MKTAPISLRRVSLLGLFALTLACTDSGSDGGSTDDATESGSESTDDVGTTDTDSDAETDDATDTDSGTTETADTTDTDDTTETGPPDCTGPSMALANPDEFTQPEEPWTPGSSWAYFELEDFQPQSCNFGETYSLESFKGRVTLVTLMRSTCEICQGTIEKLEEMQLELTLAGYDVWFVAINQMGYESSQQEFIDRTSFPLLQDTAEVDAWELMNTTGVGTDDMYIYDPDGVLQAYFNYADADPTIDLSTQAGWDNVYNALIAALEG